MDVVIYVINKTFNAVQDVLEIMSNLIVETVDSIDLFLNEFFDECGAQTSRRYRFVKILGNMGYDKQRVWRATRHTWFARSNILNMCGGGIGRRLDVRESTIRCQRHGVMGEPTLIRTRQEIQLTVYPSRTNLSRAECKSQPAQFRDSCDHGPMTFSSLMGSGVGFNG